MKSFIEKKEGIEFTTIPPALAKLAGNRDAITTPEFAQVISAKQQTLRKNYCLTGHAYGIKPIKIGNRLLWSVEKIAQMLSRGC